MLFEKKHLRPSEVVLLLGGLTKGESSMSLSEELGVSRSTVHELRRELQNNAERLQPTTPLVDDHTETDECFQNAGKKVSATWIRRTTHPEGELTSAAGTIATTTTDRQ
jgi:hypothetical protein